LQRSVATSTTATIQRSGDDVGEVAMAAIALLAMPLVRRPVDEESAAPERGEQLAPHLLDMIDRSAHRVGRAFRRVFSCAPMTVKLHARP
jgi:hypothetical protein